MQCASLFFVQRRIPVHSAVFHDRHQYRFTHSLCSLPESEPRTRSYTNRQPIDQLTEKFDSFDPVHVQSLHTVLTQVWISGNEGDLIALAANTATHHWNTIVYEVVIQCLSCVRHTKRSRTLIHKLNSKNFTLLADLLHLSFNVCSIQNTKWVSRSNDPDLSLVLLRNYKRHASNRQLTKTVGFRLSNAKPWFPIQTINRPMHVDREDREREKVR